MTTAVQRLRIVAALAWSFSLAIGHSQIVDQFRHVDPITDEVFEGLVLWSEVDDVSGFAQLTLACSNEMPVMGLEFGFTTYPTGREWLPITYRFDSDLPLETDGHVPDPEGHMVFLLDGRTEFVVELFASNRLALRTIIDGGEEATAVFNLAETGGPLRQLDCFVEAAYED